MAGTTTSIKIDMQLLDEAMKVLGAKSRTEAVRISAQEIVALQRPMKKHARKLEFTGTPDGVRHL